MTSIPLLAVSNEIFSPIACAIKIPIATGRINIRIHRDITGEMWFGVG